MKNLISILFIIAINQSIASSDSTNNLQYGLRSGFYLTNYASSLNYFGYATIKKSKSVLSFGPSFGKRPYFHGAYININSKKEMKLNGFDIAYRIHPNGYGKIFDFYFQFDFFQKWAKGNGYKTFSNYPNLYDDTKDNIQVKSIAMQLFFEYGFNIKFLKYFYLGTALGIGNKFEKRYFIQETLTQFNYQEKEIGLDFIFRANVGFRL